MEMSQSAMDTSHVLESIAFKSLWGSVFFGFGTRLSYEARDEPVFARRTARGHHSLRVFTQAAAAAGTAM